MANSSLELIFQGKNKNRKPAQIINLDLDDSRQTLADCWIHPAQRRLGPQGSIAQEKIGRILRTRRTKPQPATVATVENMLVVEKLWKNGNLNWQSNIETEPNMGNMFPYYPWYLPMIFPFRGVSILRVRPSAISTVHRGRRHVIAKSLCEISLSRSKLSTSDNWYMILYDIYVIIWWYMCLVHVKCVLNISTVKIVETVNSSHHLTSKRRAGSG